MTKKTFLILASVLFILIVGLVLAVLDNAGLINFGKNPAASSQSLSGQVSEDTPVTRLIVENGAVGHVVIDDFETFIETADRPVFVDFWAAWCGPCRTAAPFVEQLALDYDGKAYVVKVNVDYAQSLARAYDAQSIPLFVVFSDGKPVDRTVGYADSIQSELRRMIDDQLD